MDVSWNSPSPNGDRGGCTGHITAWRGVCTAETFRKKKWRVILNETQHSVFTSRLRSLTYYQQHELLGLELGFWAFTLLIPLKISVIALHLPERRLPPKRKPPPQTHLHKPRLLERSPDLTSEERGLSTFRNCHPLEKCSGTIANATNSGLESAGFPAREMQCWVLGFFGKKQLCKQSHPTDSLTALGPRG